MDHMGPIDTAKQLNIQLSPLGVIPKKNKPGKWHLIMDLSSQGSSISNRISKEDCSFCYISVDFVVQQIRQFGPGTVMGKIDIEQAYRNIPVTPCDQRLLVRYRMAIPNLHREGSTIWPPLCTHYYILCSSRCPPMDNETKRHVISHPLH